jgi:NADH-quinone oxidoreductase subunit F
MDGKKVLICFGTGCIANGSQKVQEAFKKEFKERNIDFPVVPEVKCTGCNGLCEKGPIVKIEPDDIAYYHVKPEDVPEIVEKTLLKSQEITRLLYFDTTLKKKVRSHKESEFMRRQFKIALRNIGEIDPAEIDDYLEAGGYKSLKKAIEELSDIGIIEAIKESGLRGRGGGGFPTGVKWETCYQIDKWPKYVICNGDEGDPGAFMDRSLMEGDPHSILEGMAIAAVALHIEKGFIYIRDEYDLALRNMQKAINQATERHYLGEHILGSQYSFSLEIVRGGGAFVCGESSALMSSIEGRVGEPRAKYIRSSEFGLFGQPTVLNNVETWANVPVIIEKGSEWFSSIGTKTSKGTKVFSLVGKVKNTGLVEIPMGVTLRELVFDIGGGILRNKEFKAVQTGGPSGGCIPKEHLDLPVDFENLDRVGSMMGSGGVIVMDERTCMVEFARYYISFLAEESCGKCVSCREGIRQMQKILTDICDGNGQEGDLDLLETLAETIKEASLCGLGKTAPNPVLSTLRYFREEYLEHIRDHRCRAGVCKALSHYYIDPAACTGCGVCKSVCSTNAIEGNLKQAHTIDETLCIACGSCIDVCAFNAVKVR